MHVPPEVPVQLHHCMSGGVYLLNMFLLFPYMMFQCAAKPNIIMTPYSLPPGSLHALLRELVTEFTLTDNLASTTTSLLRSMCHHDDSILLGSWLEDTDQQSVEEQLQTNSAAGSGTLEHDPNSVYMTDRLGTALPDPLPLGVAVIDAAIVLFGKAFPSVSPKHRQQLLLHFKECISQAKAGRQQTIQINIFTAFLAALKASGGVGKGWVYVVTQGGVEGERWKEGIDRGLK